MSNRLYVGNLPFHATEDLINQKFATCGEVREVALMLDRMTGQSRGFCFVEMATQEGAEKALSELNGQDFEGRALRVDVAQERVRAAVVAAAAAAASAAVAAAAAVSGGGGGGGGRGGRGGGGDVRWPRRPHVCAVVPSACSSRLTRARVSRRSRFIPRTSVSGHARG